MYGERLAEPVAACLICGQALRGYSQLAGAGMQCRDRHGDELRSAIAWHRVAVEAIEDAAGWDSQRWWRLRLFVWRLAPRRWVR
jgi:hypothetical protein